MKAICVVCEVEFERRRNAKTCSKNCSAKRQQERALEYQRKNRDEPARRARKGFLCVICGKRFDAKNPRHVACSPECSKARRKEKLKEIRQSPKCREWNKDYEQRPTRKAAMAKRRATVEYRDYQRRYQRWIRETKSKYQEYHREYMREYHASPKHKEYKYRYEAAQRAAKRLGLPPSLYAALKIAERFSQSQPPEQA